MEESRPMCTHIGKIPKWNDDCKEVNKVLNEFIPNGETSDSQVKGNKCQRQGSVSS